MTDQPVRYRSDADRWRAVHLRDEAADGWFCYVVRTTGTYSRPSCVARPARKENLIFFATTAEARACGYRPCRRCRPDDRDVPDQYAAAVIKACRFIENADEPPSLDELARTAGFSRFHFHRIFKSYTGLTPHGYLVAIRSRRVRRELAQAETVSDAIYSAGFNSNGHFYAASDELLGMTPTAFRSGGRGELIRYGTARSQLGVVLVALAAKGVCAVSVAPTEAELAGRLGRWFPRAVLCPDDPEASALAMRSLAEVERTGPRQLALPADIAEAVFSERLRLAVQHGRSADRRTALTG